MSASCCIRDFCSERIVAHPAVSKADAQLIIAGDKDLLALRAYRGIRIVTARQYLEEIETH